MKNIFHDEMFWYFFMIAWFIFVGVNVNSLMGFTYYMMMAFAIILYWADPKRTIQFTTGKETILWKIVQGGIIYGIFIFASSILIPLIEKVDTGSIIRLLGATAPALSQSKILNFLTFALAIPFVETLTFIRYFDFTASRLKIRIDRQGMWSLPALMLVAAFSIAFLIMHLTAKGVTNSSALGMVFIMMAVSLIVAMYYGESKQALWFHVIANTVASIPLFL